MKLFRGAMIRIELNDPFFINWQTGPPAFQADVGYQQLLTVFIDASLDHEPDAVFVAFPVSLIVYTE